jgi:hypothetical protein
MFFLVILFQKIIKTNDDETFANLCQTRIHFLWSSFFVYGEKIVLRFVIVLVFIVIIRTNEDEQLEN